MSHSIRSDAVRISCRNFGRLTFLLAPLTAALLAGCPASNSTLFQSLGIPIPPADAFAPQAVVGGSPARVVFSRFNYGDAVSTLNSVAFGMPDLAGVDLTQGGVTTVLPTLADVSERLLTDGVWVAAADYTDRRIRTLNLDTGAAADLFQDQLPTDWSLLALNAGRLLVSMARGGQTLLVLQDLSTGQQTLRLENLLSTGYSAALDGNVLALVDFPPLDPHTPLTISAALAAQVEYVDLATGERTLLATLSGDARVDFLAVTGARVIWSETSDGVSRVRVRDTTGGDTTTLIDWPAGGGETEFESVAVRAAGPAGIVIDRSSLSGAVVSLADAANVTSHELLQLVDFAGNIFTLDEYDQGLHEAAYYSTAPAVVGQSVIYRNAKTGQWNAYDSNTGSISEIAPF